MGAELSHLLSKVLSPAVLDGPERNTFTWNHSRLHSALYKQQQFLFREDHFPPPKAVKNYKKI